MLIAIVGPDGCGKTTLAHELAAALRADGRDVRFFEMNFGVLPRFRDMASVVLRRPVGRSHAPGEHLAGMRHAPSSALRSSVYVVWYGLDYILGGWKYRAERKDGVIIFARYAYDYDIQRSYERVPAPLRRAMLRLVPQPDLVFTVHRDAEEIFAAKPELSVEEIRRQQGRINAILGRSRNFHNLDGRGGIGATVARALAIVRGAAA